MLKLPSVSQSQCVVDLDAKVAGISVAHVADAQADQVAGTQFAVDAAVDTQIE